MNKDIFVKLIELVKESDETYSKLYETLILLGVKNKTVIGAFEMIEPLLKAHYGELGVDITRDFLYQNPLIEYSAYKPFSVNETGGVIWDADSLYWFLENTELDTVDIGD